MDAAREAVFRRVGGLEVINCGFRFCLNVFRRVGGLEDKLLGQRTRPSVFRRVGGLEVSDPALAYCRYMGNFGRGDRI